MARKSRGTIKVPKSEIVTLGLDKNGDLTCKPKMFRVSKNGKKHDRMLIVWRCTTHADFSVDFNKNGTPFHESHFDQDDYCSGLVRRRVQSSGKTYEYSVTIAGKSFDPGGRVDP